LLVVSLARAAGSGDPPGGPPGLGTSSSASIPAAACPLTPAQERTAVDAFDKMMPVVQHPRCINCHGGVNPYADPSVGKHLGGKIDNSADTTLRQTLAKCQDCHSGLPGWDVPVDIMFFVGKSAKELCILFKRAEATGARFVGHIQHENGGVQFVASAFKGDRALNTLGEITYEEKTGARPMPERPPGTHQELVAKAQDWVDAVGAGWRTTPDCGCKVSGSWEGTVTADFVFQGGQYGTLRETSRATVRLERYTSRQLRGDRVTYWKSTGGTVYWEAKATEGACTGMHAGTVPLDGLDPDGYPMAELRLQDLGNGSISYDFTAGLLEKWWPPFTYRCKFDGQIVDLPDAHHLPTWWHHAFNDLPVSTDPQTVKGTYKEDFTGGTMVWRWELHLQP
jgi:hypothetical protein